jgi:hypothetical protein
LSSTLNRTKGIKKLKNHIINYPYEEEKNEEMVAVAKRLAQVKKRQLTIANAE